MSFTSDISIGLNVWASVIGFRANADIVISLDYVIVSASLGREQ